MPNLVALFTVNMQWLINVSCYNEFLLSQREKDPSTVSNLKLNQIIGIYMIFFAKISENMQNFIIELDYAQNNKLYNKNFQYIKMDLIANNTALKRWQKTFRMKHGNQSKVTITEKNEADTSDMVKTLTRLLHFGTTESHNYLLQCFSLAHNIIPDREPLVQPKCYVRESMCSADSVDSRSTSV